MGDEILGPIDLLAVEFPRGHVTGEGFDLLLGLIERGIIRVLDLEFVDVLDRLTQLGQLRAGGVLTEAEFEAQKARILNS